MTQLSLFFMKQPQQGSRECNVFTTRVVSSQSAGQKRVPFRQTLARDAVSKEIVMAKLHGRGTTDQYIIIKKKLPLRIRRHPGAMNHFATRLFLSV